ncbi:MAG TPA: UDP-N-acetylglucosamine 2-epimerase, partial [Thermoleophilia bacterium]|nr:UDP-N-acetylglucosamine 2-epimerase [Thermoleophilia bacterium]
GLRSRDREMPEEINRILTDQIADLLFTTSRDADENLLAEGIAAEKIHFVGNPMIDSLDTHREKAKQSRIHEELGLQRRAYGVVTLHRPSNVDEPEGLHRLVRVLNQTAAEMPLVWPVHARTRARLENLGLLEELLGRDALRLTEPLGYLDFVVLLSAARLVLTDSGGIQEETTVLGVPCLTLRKNTERPVTIWQGTNRLVDPEDEEEIAKAVGEVLARSDGGESCRPELWDGRASERIVAESVRWLIQREGV